MIELTQARPQMKVLFMSGYTDNAIGHHGVLAADILLTDLRMPDMSGVELFKRTQKTHPDLVVILMTAYAADEIIQHELNEGILAIVTKPLDIDRLLTLFSTAMRPDHR